MHPATIEGGGNVAAVGGGGGKWVPSGNTIFLQGFKQLFARGTRLKVKASQNGTYTYRDSAGESRTVERWVFAIDILGGDTLLDKHQDSTSQPDDANPLDRGAYH